MGAADPDETKCTFSTYVEYTQLTGVTAQEMCTASGTTYIDSAPETDPTFGYPVRIICTYPTMKFYHYDTPCGSEDGCGYASYATLVEGCEAGGGTASEEFPDIE